MFYVCALRRGIQVGLAWSMHGFIDPPSDCQQGSLSLYKIHICSENGFNVLEFRAFTILFFVFVKYLL